MYDLLQSVAVIVVSVSVMHWIDAKLGSFAPARRIRRRPTR
jgi:hypothetical protein